MTCREVPAALREHSCIRERDGAETESWRFTPAPGRRLSPVVVRLRLVVNSAAAAVASAIAGHGIIRVLSYQTAAAVAAGELLVLLAPHEPPPIPVYLVLPPGRAQTAKQRAFVAFVVAPLRRALADAARQLASAPRPPRRKPRTK